MIVHENEIKKYLLHAIKCVNMKDFNLWTVWCESVSVKNNFHLPCLSPNLDRTDDFKCDYD